PMVLNQDALNLIRRHYSAMENTVTLTSHRRKMAILPEGSKPLPNPIGTAPGVIMKPGRTMIVSLPGVPGEMRAIFKGSVLPLLQTPHSGPPQEAFIFLTGVIESALAPVLQQAQRRYPGLYFKSHPRGKETGVKPLIQIHIYSTARGSQQKIGNALTFLVHTLSSLAPRTY
ncbi:MAG TPA: competence damage-inducible protein A, partial [Candidatus Bathyarchaeia archaeon]